MIITEKKCSVEGCEAKVRCKSLCGLHYRRHLSGIPMDAPMRIDRGRYKTCTVVWCTRKYYANKFCALHYRRDKKSLDLDIPIVHATRHGQSNSATYRTWAAMKQRCTNSNVTNYRHYGKKGIKVCSKWLNSFQHFVDDMGEKPSARHSLDRIDNKGDYSPENCRWAISQQQVINRGLSRNNSSGRKGVCWDKRTRSYAVSIGLNYKSIHLGRFKEYEKAIEMRDLAEKKYFKPILEKLNETPITV